MRIKYFLLFLLIVLCMSGCSLDPYVEPKYGEMAVDSWFNDKTLGEVRRNSENINEIVSTLCEYVESKSNKYVFKCKVTYKEQGETVIPLSKNSVVTVYSVFIKKKGNKYDFKVYNSKYTKEDKIWEQDEYLGY